MLECSSVDVFSGFAESPLNTESDSPRMGTGPCSFPGCSKGGGFNACTGYLGTGDSCGNCYHGWNYHA